MSESSKIVDRIISPDRDRGPDEYQRGLREGRMLGQGEGQGESKVEAVKKGLKMVTGIKIDKDFIKKFHYNPRRASEVYMHPSTKLTSMGGVRTLSEATDPRFIRKQHLKSEIYESTGSDPLSEVVKEYEDLGYSRSEIKDAIRDLIRQGLVIKKGKDLEVAR
jgi:DNA-binding transcriptional regulator YhcF (GntR family)